MNWKIAILGAAATIALVSAPGAWAAVVETAKPAAAKPAALAVSATAVVQAAAQAMGGAEKLRAVRNITAHGYAQYAYMMGGGRITGDPDAPEKYIAANDLTRVYDLEHDRYQARERRNMLFPFLLPGGHAFVLSDWYLDGDIAYDMDAGGMFSPIHAPTAVRRSRYYDDPLMVDGVHARRMWFLTNPAVLIRTMMTSQAKLSAPRQEKGVIAIDLTLPSGEKLTAGFGANHLPAWVRWATPQTNIGEEMLTTHYTGWVAADGQGGLLLPMAFETRSDWRNVDFFKMYIDGYETNSKTPDLAAPAEVKATPEPASYAPGAHTATPIGKGLWRIDDGTTVVEFKDHVVLFELGVNSRGDAKAVMDLASRTAHGKPVTQLITSHHHFDHTAGLRYAVSQGVTIIQRPDALRQYRDMIDHPAREFPDDLAKSGKRLKSITMDEHLRLQDETQTLDIYWGRNNPHMSDVLFGYVPSEKLMMEGDLVSAAYDWQHWPDTFRDVNAYYHLDVQRVSPAHNWLPNHPGTVSLKEVEDNLQGGIDRARKHCADEVAKGNYHPGCPIQSKYY
jgi:hypothetical protein